MANGMSCHLLYCVLAQEMPRLGIRGCPQRGCLAADDSSNRGLLIYDEECPAPPYSERWGHEAKCLAQPYSEKWKQVDFAQPYSEMCNKRLTWAVIDCTVYPPRRCLDWAFVDAPRGGVWQSMTAWLDEIHHLIQRGGSEAIKHHLIQRGATRG